MGPKISELGRYIVEEALIGAIELKGGKKVGKILCKEKKIL